MEQNFGLMVDRLHNSITEQTRSSDPPESDIFVAGSRQCEKSHGPQHLVRRFLPIFLDAHDPKAGVFENVRGMEDPLDKSTKETPLQMPPDFSKLFLFFLHIVTQCVSPAVDAKQHTKRWTHRHTFGLQIKAAFGGVIIFSNQPLSLMLLRFLEMVEHYPWTKSAGFLMKVFQLDLSHWTRVSRPRTGPGFWRL